MKPEQEPKREYGSLRLTALLSSVGLTLALSIAIGAGIGLLADRWLHSKGLLVILGTLLGIGAGFKQLIQTVIRAGREQEAADAEERDRREQS